MSLHTSDLVLVPGRQLKPLDNISGFQVRPGFFRFFGATIIPFTGRRKSPLQP